jgi:hypothetical protein
MSSFEDAVGVVMMITMMMIVIIIIVNIIVSMLMINNKNDNHIVIIIVVSSLETQWVSSPPCELLLSRVSHLWTCVACCFREWCQFT